MNRAGLAAGMLMVILSCHLAFSLTASLDSSDDLQDILLWTDVPRNTTTGQRITLLIEVENARFDEAFHLEDIDVTERFMEGFSVVAVQPAPNDQYIDEGDLTLEYSLLIHAQTSQQFFIELEAKETGVFSGDVDIWGSEEEEDGDFTTTRIQTKVE